MKRPLTSNAQITTKQVSRIHSPRRITLGNDPAAPSKDSNNPKVNMTARQPPLLAHNDNSLEARKIESCLQRGEGGADDFLNLESSLEESSPSIVTALPRTSLEPWKKGEPLLCHPLWNIGWCRTCETFLCFPMIQETDISSPHLWQLE